MNFEDKAAGGLGKYTSGTSKRRFYTALAAAAIIVAVVIIQGQLGKKRPQDPADLVNPLMGTDSEYQALKREYISCNCSAMGDEFLDTPDTKNGRWMGLYL